MSMGSNSGESGRQACAACRHQRKRCEEDCMMAPYFPADKEVDFKAVHKVFGVSNMSKMLKFLSENELNRTNAVESFIWEAYMWNQDAVNGPLGKYKELQKEVELLRNALNQQNALESIVLEDQGINRVGIKDQVEGGGVVVVPTFGSSTSLNYACTNQNMAILDDGSTNNGSYTALLQGQDTKCKGVIVDSCVAATNYQTPISQGLLSQGRSGFQGVIDQRSLLPKQEPRRVGLDSTMMPLESNFSPIIQGGNNAIANYNNGNIRPLQGRGRGSSGVAGIECVTNIKGPLVQGQARGHLVYDPCIGQGQQRVFGPLGAQICPRFSDASPGHTRATTQKHEVRFTPYPHPHRQPVHGQRHAMGQDQNHQNFPQYSWNNRQSYDNIRGKGSVSSVALNKTTNCVLDVKLGVKLFIPDRHYVFHIQPPNEKLI